MSELNDEKKTIEITSMNSLCKFHCIVLWSHCVLDQV